MAHMDLISYNNDGFVKKDKISCGDFKSRLPRTFKHVLNENKLDQYSRASRYLGEARLKDELNKDTRTVLTDSQELDVPEDLREKLAWAFSRELLRHVRIALVHWDDGMKLRNALSDFLKGFSLRLHSNVNTRQQIDAITFVHNYRQLISKLVESSMKLYSGVNKDYLQEEEEEDIPFGKWEGLSTIEKMRLWDTQRKKMVQLEDNNIDQLDTYDENEIVDYAITHFRNTWQFLTNSYAYKWLVWKVRTELVLTEREGSMAEIIKKKIHKGLAVWKKNQGPTQGSCVAEFEVSPWNLLRFLQQQYMDVQLGSIITIIGSGVDAQALTCAEALQGAVEREPGIQYECVTADGTYLSLTVNFSRVLARVEGIEPAIAEIGQQLSWLGAALRSSPYGNRMAYSMPSIAFSAGSVPSFKLSIEVVDIEQFQQGAEPNGSCWHSLFKNPVIVKDFPILARFNEEKGLEIPLNMMAGLGKATRATEFDGHLVIKGFSTMFCPTQQIKSSVLWHYLFNEDGSRMSYLSAEQLSGRALTKDVDVACLKRSRNFLGWASSVETYAGAKDTTYSEIEWAGSNLASAGIAFEKASIVAGNFITGGVSFTRGDKDTPICLGRERTYAQEIHSAHNMSVVLYDVRDRRGWLIDGASVLLHITRTQLSSSPYSESELFRLESFHHADPSAGVAGTKAALMNLENRQLLIFEDVEISTESKVNIDGAPEEQVKKTTRGWTYQGLVQQAYHVLEQIHDHETKMMTTRGLNIRFTNREKLIGFGFMDIVDGQNTLLPKVATLNSSGRGWVDFTQSIRAITLFGKGFGEIIRPAKDSNKLCKYWNHVPIGKDYLVACIATLKKICVRNGDCESNPLELANGIHWHKPDKLFEPCDCKHGGLMGICDRVQVLLPRSLGSKKHPQPFGYQNGAVIFGRSKRFPWCWPTTGEPSQEGVSDSELDNESIFRDSALGESITSSSKSDRSKETEPSSSNGSSPVHGICTGGTTQTAAEDQDQVCDTQPTTSWLRPIWKPICSPIASLPSK